MTRFGRIDADDKLDRYYTPDWATRALLERIDVEGKTILEPCAGQGHIVRVLEEYGANVRGYDIDPQSPYSHPEWDATDAESYLQKIYYPSSKMSGERHGLDGVITNPPYSADSGTAADVIETALDTLKVGVWALVRLSFLEPASGRHELLSRASECIVLPRVHYTGPALEDGSANPGTSCWVYWCYEWVDSACQTKFVSKSERDRLKGQNPLFEE